MASALWPKVYSKYYAILVFQHDFKEISSTKLFWFPFSNQLNFPNLDGFSLG